VGHRDEWRLLLLVLLLLLSVLMKMQWNQASARLALLQEAPWLANLGLPAHAAVAVVGAAAATLPAGCCWGSRAAAWWTSFSQAGVAIAQQLHSESTGGCV